MLAIALAAVVAAVSSPAASPSPSPTPIPQIVRVLTSDRGLESAARAARTTYVLSATDIARNGYRTVAEALAQVPGVNVARYGAFGTLATVGIRGSSEPQVLVLLDGLPLAGAQTQSLDLNQVATTGIDRIEVVEGGGSTLYGSGSVGGVINIVSAGKAPTSATVSTGSFGQQTYAFQTPFLSFVRTYAANDYGLPGGGTRTNSDAGLTAGTFTYEHALGAVDVKALANLSRENLGAAGPIDYLSQTSRQITVAQNYQLHFEHRGARATTTLALGQSAQSESFTCDTPVDMDCVNAYAVPTPGASAPPYAELVQDQHLALNLTNAVTSDRSRVVYGIDLMRGNDRVDGGTGSACVPPYLYYYNCMQAAYRSAVTTNAYAQTAAFVQSQWFFANGAGVYAGLRGERDLNALATAQGGALSPSIGGIVPLGSNWQLKLNAATAFRAPTALELFYPPQGVFSNPGLVPERLRVGDASMVRTGRFGTATFTWFTTTGSNLIVDENPAAYNYEPVNIGRASIQGVTLGLQTTPWRHLAIDAGLTNLYRAQDLDTNERIVGRGPVFAARFGLKYVPAPSSHFDGAGLTISNSGQNEPANFALPAYAQAQAFTTLDLYAGWRVAPHALLAVRGFNLLDDRYAVYNGYPMPGPGFALELRSR